MSRLNKNPKQTNEETHLKYTIQTMKITGIYF